MAFASAYLSERALFPALIKEAPDKETGMIVVVPAYNEPGIKTLLGSLASCTRPDCKAEVIIVINAPADASIESIENNKITLKNVESWKRENRNCFFRLFAFMVEMPAGAGWGVGLARKAGMDEAVRRFDKINNPDGVILSLDADCLVEKNYFKSVCDEFLNRKERTACSIYFEHPLAGNDFPENIYKYITLYELHLRYYFQGLALTGFPYVFHTVGSAIAFRTLAYVRAGGMNRRQAGEDFYFVQKLAPAEGYFNLNSTTVYPSPRPSSRVPFGTGATIGKLAGTNGLPLKTYNIMTFKELEIFFNSLEEIYNYSPGKLHGYFQSLPRGLRFFLDEQEWYAKVIEIKNNTSGLASFKKRFFGWFNAFKIVKYLNYVHADIFEKRPVEISACELLENAGMSFNSNNPVDLLLFYRELERNSTLLRSSI